MSEREYIWVETTCPKCGKVNAAGSWYECVCGQHLRPGLLSRFAPATERPARPASTNTALELSVAVSCPKCRARLSTLAVPCPGCAFDVSSWVWGVVRASKVAHTVSQQRARGARRLLCALRGHDWQGCYCVRCHKSRHEWELGLQYSPTAGITSPAIGCSCTGCGATRHRWAVWRLNAQQCFSCRGRGRVATRSNHPDFYTKTCETCNGRGTVTTTARLCLCCGEIS